MPVRVRTMRQLKRLMQGLPLDTAAARARSRRVEGVSEPQRRLWEAVKARYPEAEHEKRRLIPGRKFIADIVIETYKLVIETDGWEYHGKYKAGFLRDREKDREFMLAGYRTCRFSAGEILKDIEAVMETLEQIIKRIEEGGDDS